MPTAISAASGSVGVGAVRDHDVALARGGEIHALIARAVAADQRQPRHGCHQRIGGADAAGRDQGLDMRLGSGRNQRRVGPSM